MSDQNLDGKVLMLEATVQAHEKRITEHGKQIDELKIQNAVQNETLRQILDVVSETKATVKTFQDRPGKRWETFVGSVITAIGAGLVGAFLVWSGIK